MKLVFRCLLAIALFTCAPAFAGNSAAFVSQDVPSVMAPGQSYPVSVTMRNTGDTTWTTGSLYRLGSQSPRDNSNWGPLRVELPGDVAPGHEVTFSFAAIAPLTVGTYDFQWQMVQDGVEWFGAPTASIAVKDGLNDSDFIAQSVPSVMTPGQAYPVSVTMKNIGNTTWTTASLYRLGSQNPQDNTTWGSLRIPLPNDVAPGASVTFAFNVSAPSTVGTYNLQWRMVQDNVEWFGASTDNIAVKDGINDAAFISQSVPEVMVPGQTYPVSVTMKNTGNVPWTSSNLYRLGSQNAQDNTTWGLLRVALPNDVAPGDNVTFNFNVTAPTTPGTFNFQWRMVEDLVEWFGSATTNVAVKDGVNDAAFVSQSVPSTMSAGQQSPVTVTMTNTGTTTWRSGTQFRLGSQHPQDNNTWSVQRVQLPADVPPGGSTTFSFQVTAPSTPGTYDFQWRMVQELVEWFGAYSTNAPIAVASAAQGTIDLQVYGTYDGEVMLEGVGRSIDVEAAASEGTITSTTLTINGVAVNAIQAANQLYYAWQNIQVGEYTITATATSDRGVTATQTLFVGAIVDPREVPIRAVLDTFKSALATGNKSAAMAVMTFQAQQAYGPVIDALLPYMSQIVSEWSQPRVMFQNEDSAEHAVVRTTNGVRTVYIFTFVLDAEGHWLIDSM